MAFSILSSITVALLALCCARSKPNKVATILFDMESAQDEIEKILSYHSKRKRC